MVDRIVTLPVWLTAAQSRLYRNDRDFADAVNDAIDGTREFIAGIEDDWNGAVRPEVEQAKAAALYDCWPVRWMLGVDPDEEPT